MKHEYITVQIDDLEYG